MKILFSTHNDFIDLAKMFHAGGHEVAAIQNNFRDIMAGLDVPVRSLLEVINEDDSLQAAKYSSIVLRWIDQVGFSSLNIDPIMMNAVEQNLIGFVYGRLYDLTTLVVALVKYRPDVIVVHNDVEPLLRTAAMWGRANGVPVVHVPHSVYLDSGRGDPGTDIHDIVTATHIAAAGPFQRKWYETRGMPSENIRETGFVHFDKMATVSPNRKLACHLLGLDPRRPVVVYASSWAQNTNLMGMHNGVQTYYERFLKVAKALEAAQFVIKCHPSDRNLKWHIDKAKGLPNVIVTGQHLPIVLQACDALISYGPSNILMEASFMPQIRLLTSHGYDDDPEVVKVGENSTPEKIAAIIRTELSKQPVDKNSFRIKYCGPSDGNSARRIAQYILDVAKK